MLAWLPKILQRAIRPGRVGSMDNEEMLHMPYEELKKITGGFSAECFVGSGSFGEVYKGKDKDGQEIAVKLLRQSWDLDGNAFIKEFNNLIKLEHPNIVQLRGFCSEDEEVIENYNGKLVRATNMHRALCFEYLHNGSLEKHLYEEDQGFDWQQRYKIIKGVCIGLKYLHVELESPLLHLDLKPDNVLLDNNMVPKISDFGLSRLLGEEKTKKTISPLGTLGYCPPEFIKDQIFSKEFDIFSLGVIIIKIMCGTPGYSLAYSTRRKKFIRQVHKKWRERLRKIPGYITLEEDSQQVKKCIEIALRCIDEEKRNRPNIESIVNQLAETEKHLYDTASVMATSQQSLANSLPKELPATFMKEITNDFSPERVLGHSGFGTVYKGILPDGELIAVKRLAENTPVAPGKLFEAEVTKLMAFRHQNIVELVSFCHEEHKKVVQHNGKYVLVDMTESCLCYKYLPKGSLDRYPYANTGPINWDTRFKIIKGICQGVHFLHMELDDPLVHMNLVPNSIWLDDNWVPKITDFGLSRLFGQEQTRMYTINVKGHNGYIAPEYLYRGEISAMADIYSLGMLILEITTQEENSSDSEDKSGRKFVDHVHQNWKTDEQMINKYPSLDPNGLLQVKACIVIGLKCVEANRNKRPSIVNIVNKLNGKRVSIFDKISPVSTDLLDIYPGKVVFPFKPNKLMSCSLQLTNNTDDCIAVSLLTKSPKKYMAKMPLRGIVPASSTYTIIVTTREQEKQQLPGGEDFFTLKSSIVQDDDLRLSDLNSATIEFGNFRKDGTETSADKVHELKLDVISGDPTEESEIEILSSRKISQVLSMDVHPMEPWIMTSHDGGDIFIWDYQALEIEASFEITKNSPVYSAKFVERKDWLVAGDGVGTICVYNYYEEEEVTKIEAHEGEITSLAVHPTGPYVLSASDDHLIKLWDWEKGWVCTQTFEGHSNAVTQVTFSRVDTDSFASASLDHTIRIWDISSSDSKMTMTDHPDAMLCVHNYIRDSRQYLITGFSDGTAQIWDMEKAERCVTTLKGHADRVTCVCHHPEHPVVITGSHDGTLRIWDSTTYRLENTIAINLGAVYALGYIEGRMVVCCRQGIAIMETNLP